MAGKVNEPVGKTEVPKSTKDPHNMKMGEPRPPQRAPHHMKKGRKIGLAQSADHDIEHRYNYTPCGKSITGRTNDILSSVDHDFIALVINFGLVLSDNTPNARLDKIKSE